MKNLFKNGTQSRWFCMFIVLALASLILMGCPTPPGPDTDPAKSTNATLSSITVKGKTAGLGTPSAIMDTIVPGTVSILDTDAGTTTGTLADAKATLTKIVKFTASETSSFAAAFASKPPYNNEAVANGDFFVFLVTAEDGNTKLYYRVNVTVQSTQISSDATLSSITINGAAANMGTPNATLGDEVAGSIILTSENTGATTGLPVDADATLTKIVKFAAGESASYVAEFASKDAYKSEAISDGDFFVFLVTAEDGSSLYYRVDVTISSSVFTLDADNVLNEDNYENVSFFAAPVSEELEDLFTTLDTSI
ncbi:MAG: hypothetical protein LBV20_07450, partial [Treponema sp.]|nr:hypothetical protein [Treponema sp.]